ncbi:M1 family metallopeptidase [Altibacter sp.]|uniref:M1 family metallopeptidase n=1 Tax=Altibacter sp. TaxID=2024823 RepID=UPI000C946A49|nr:M1 family metallopeptidase [Altibacter sp.]MAP54682.1 aminopeptidase [Altibacter sp.]
MRLLISAFLLCFASLLVAQQTEVVDFLKVEAVLIPNVSESSIEGSVRYTFKVLQETDSLYLDAKNMKVLANPSHVKTVASTDRIWLLGDFTKGKEYTAAFTYKAFPRQTLYFVGEQLWTQGQGKYTSHWLPSIDDMNDKIEFDLTLASPKNKTVIANGVLKQTYSENELTYWQWDMQQPMSSYLVAFAIGPFKKREIKSKSSIPIALYISEGDTAKWEPTYRYSKEIFNFLEAEIGVPYPWQNYKQVPVKDFLYAGMENTTATFFSEAFVVDSIAFNDRNYINVNAHELAHQWFGNLVTETEGTHHWLHEGFATYYALLAEKEIFGDAYYYWKLYQSAEQLKAMSDDGKGESLLDPKASSLTFYEKGAWALHMLKEIIGKRQFQQAVKNYLTKYAFKNVTTDNFLDEVKAVTAVDISQWEKDWLQQTAFKAAQAYESLKKNDAMLHFFEVTSLRDAPFAEKKVALSQALQSDNEYVGQEVVYQLANESVSEALLLYQKALQSDNLYIRQAVALTMEEIPPSLQASFENLLNDPSYSTQEAALYRLWSAVPERRAFYLDTMKGVLGFQDRNVRQLWLALALLTEGYQEANKRNFLEELKGYTAPEFAFEVRERAFGYVYELGLFDEDTLEHLVNASVHHNWRFRNSARSILKEVLRDPVLKAKITGMWDFFSEAEKKSVQSLEKAE